MHLLVDMSKIGEVIGNIRYGNVVQFWCRSLDGGPTDSRQVNITFPNEAIAIAVAEACGPVAIARSEQAAVS
jgi:hypothetical protein